MPRGNDVGEYTLAAGKSDGELIETVNHLITKRWFPIGGPLLVHHEGEPILLQALVRSKFAQKKKIEHA